MALRKTVLLAYLLLTLWGAFPALHGHDHADSRITVSGEAWSEEELAGLALLEKGGCSLCQWHNTPQNHAGLANTLPAWKDALALALPGSLATPLLGDWGGAVSPRGPPAFFPVPA